MPHGKFDPEKVTDVQEAFWVGLTPQRVANMWAAADDWAELSADTKEFLRTAKPETMEFLRDARPEEISNLKDGIRLVVATQLLGRVGRWTVVTLFGTFVGMMLVWDRVAAWFKVAK